MLFRALIIQDGQKVIPLQPLAIEGGFESKRDLNVAKAIPPHRRLQWTVSEL